MTQPILSDSVCALAACTKVLAVPADRAGNNGVNGPPGWKKVGEVVNLTDAQYDRVMRPDINILEFANDPGARQQDHRVQRRRRRFSQRWLALREPRDR